MTKQDEVKALIEQLAQELKYAVQQANTDGQEKKTQICLDFITNKLVHR